MGEKQSRRQNEQVKDGWDEAAIPGVQISWEVKKYHQMGFTKMYILMFLLFPDVSYFFSALAGNSHASGVAVCGEESRDETNIIQVLLPTAKVR